MIDVRHYSVNDQPEYVIDFRSPPFWTLSRIAPKPTGLASKITYM